MATSALPIHGEYISLGPACACGRCNVHKFYYDESWLYICVKCKSLINVKRELREDVFRMSFDERKKLIAEVIKKIKVKEILK